MNDTCKVMYIICTYKDSGEMCYTTLYPCLLKSHNMYNVLQTKSLDSTYTMQTNICDMKD